MTFHFQYCSQLLYKKLGFNVNQMEKHLNAHIVSSVSSVVIGFKNTINSYLIIVIKK